MSGSRSHTPTISQPAIRWICDGVRVGDLAAADDGDLKHVVFRSRQPSK